MEGEWQVFRLCIGVCRFGFAVVVDDGCGCIGEGDVLEDVCGGGGVVEVDSVVAVGWCQSVRVGLVVLIVECAVVVIMQHNGWATMEDVVDVVVLVELWIGGLASTSSSISWCAYLPES